jgi:BirA family transcriptional regulator, biotin operon repressor / biotin---[acetyl-CoA-carboxylase] ligase
MLKIPVAWLEECDSTSRVLKERAVKANYAEPQALAARVQTAGSGRLGEKWHSLAGNLHFSVALPPSSVPEDLRDTMPFVAAIIVARWVRRVCGVAVCLKWPNDVLLDGKKIAGILCEGSIQGAQFLGLVIGVGVNLSETPRLPEGVAYAAGCLKNLTGLTLDPRMAAESLAAEFAEFLPGLLTLTRAKILLDWSNLAISPGHLWTKKLVGNEPHKPENYYRNLGVAAAGHLRLLPLTTFARGTENEAEVEAQEISVSSSTHQFVWSGQSTSKENIRVLIADVGNSQTKMAVIDHPSQGSIRVLGPVIQVANESSLADFFREKRGHCLAPIVHAISVSPSRLEAFRGVCASHGFEVREIEKKPVRAVNSLYDMEAIGADRLALLEAAYYLQIQKNISTPIMAVSLGTATTVDHVDAGGKHLGGYILAGIQTSLDAISQRGARLPKVLSLTGSFEREVSSWPTTTVQAMELGAVDATVAFLKSERKRLADHCRITVERVPMVMAGGFSSLVKKALIAHHSPELSELISADDTLILLGAGILAINGR